MKRLLLIAVVLLATLGCEADIKPGQKWRYEYKNPFETYSREYEVIAVEDGYVQYREVISGRIDVETEYMFKINAKVVE